MNSQSARRGERRRGRDRGADLGGALRVTEDIDAPEARRSAHRSARGAHYGARRAGEQAEQFTCEMYMEARTQLSEGIGRHQKASDGMRCHPTASIIPDGGEEEDPEDEGERRDEGPHVCMRDERRKTRPRHQLVVRRVEKYMEQVDGQARGEASSGNDLRAVSSDWKRVGSSGKQFRSNQNSGGEPARGEAGG